MSNIKMMSLNEFIIYGSIIGCGVYGILIVPYYGSQILMKNGESGRLWFTILALCNIWALIFIFITPSLRRGIPSTDLKKLIGFACGYIILFLMLIFILIYVLDNL
jgi:hypothetical protein